MEGGVRLTKWRKVGIVMLNNQVCVLDLGKFSREEEDNYSIAHLCVMFGKGDAMKAVLQKHPDSSRYLRLAANF